MNTILATSTLILSGGQVVLGLLAVGLAIYCGIFATKTYLKQQSEKIRNQDGMASSSSTVRKYEGVDIQQHSKNIKLAGFASALAIVLIVFAWTQFTNEQVLADLGIVYAEDMEIEIPPTTIDQPKLPPALPPPPSEPALDIIIDDTKPEPKVEEKPKEITDSPTPTDYTGPTDVTSDIMPPAPIIEEIPEEPVVEKEIEFMIVEQMPRFPGCEETAGDNKAKKACADQKLLNYIQGGIKYPVMARENGIEGIAVISFVVNKDGSISDYKIVRDPGAGCGKEALRMVKSMNNLPQKWTPGKQRGKEVKVRYNLPVRFKLNG